MNSPAAKGAKDGGIRRVDSPRRYAPPLLCQGGNFVQKAAWPTATVIVGNPPFLGDKKQLAILGDAYMAALRQVYQGRVPGGADLVCYWFEKARAQIEAGQAQRAGLVATNSIRGGQNSQDIGAHPRNHNDCPRLVG